jgi:hypothetical protein
MVSFLSAFSNIDGASSQEPLDPMQPSVPALIEITILELQEFLFGGKDIFCFGRNLAGQFLLSMAECGLGRHMERGPEHIAEGLDCLFEVLADGHARLLSLRV